MRSRREFGFLKKAKLTDTKSGVSSGVSCVLRGWWTEFEQGNQPKQNNYIELSMPFEHCELVSLSNNLPQPTASKFRI